jgi:hypothetical protein
MAKSNSSSDLIPDRSAFVAGPRAKAILRGKAIAAEVLRSSGGAYALAEVRSVLNGVTRRSIEKRVREGKLLAAPGPNNRRFYPDAQFTDDGCVVERMQAVLKALPTENGFALLKFLVNPNSLLGDAKPIDLLKNGAVEAVVEAAGRYGEQGARAVPYRRSTLLRVRRKPSSSKPER